MRSPSWWFTPHDITVELPRDPGEEDEHRSDHQLALSELDPPIASFAGSVRGAAAPLAVAVDLPIETAHPVVRSLPLPPVCVVLIDQFPPLRPIDVGMSRFAKAADVLPVRDALPGERPVYRRPVDVRTHRSFEGPVSLLGILVLLPAVSRERAFRKLDPFRPLPPPLPRSIRSHHAPLATSPVPASRPVQSSRSAGTAGLRRSRRSPASGSTRT